METKNFQIAARLVSEAPLVIEVVVSRAGKELSSRKMPATKALVDKLRELGRLD